MSAEGSLFALQKAVCSLCPHGAPIQCMQQEEAGTLVPHPIRARIPS